MIHIYTYKREFKVKQEKSLSHCFIIYLELCTMVETRVAVARHGRVDTLLGCTQLLLLRVQDASARSSAPTEMNNT